MPITPSRRLTWCLVRDRVVRLGIWLRGPHCRAQSVLVPMRFANLAVLRVFGWLALPARSDRAKDAEIRAPRTQLEVAM